ncbi:hypothetical protein OROMI_008248 [Orobanche minor]
MATATTMVVGPKPFPSEPPPTRQKTEYDLRRELLRSQEEVKRIQSVPLVIG